jgi:hypothetical protein
VIQKGFNQATNIVPSDDGWITFISSLSSPFPNGILQPNVSSLERSPTLETPSVYFFNPQHLAPRAF